MHLYRFLSAYSKCSINGGVHSVLYDYVYCFHESWLNALASVLMEIHRVSKYIRVCVWEWYVYMYLVL